MVNDLPTTPSIGGPITCPSCDEAAPGDANWCEACGSDLVLPSADTLGNDPMNPANGAGIADAAGETSLPPATDPCISCGAEPSDVTADGWCGICGTKQPAPGDHVVDDHGSFAVVSDRGRIHRTNEDAGAVGRNDADQLALVVCDGVSSTDDSHHASQAAVASALDTLLSGTGDAGELLALAAGAAQQSVLDATPAVVSEPPSCTFVAALVESTDAAQARVTVAWLGDSRAYWVDESGARLLTRDHSWAIEQADLGVLAPDEIASDPRAHSITRWLGADALDPTPDVVELTVDGSGVLLLCSDGLWNYTDTLDLLARTVADHGGLHSPSVELAEALVAFANDSGGHDNITVAVANFPLPSASNPDRSSDV